MHGDHFHPCRMFFYTDQPAQAGGLPKAVKPEDLNPGGPLFSAGISYYDDGEYDLPRKI